MVVSSYLPLKSGKRLVKKKRKSRMGKNKRKCRNVYASPCIVIGAKYVRIRTYVDANNSFAGSAYAGIFDMSCGFS